MRHIIYTRYSKKKLYATRSMSASVSTSSSSSSSSCHNKRTSASSPATNLELTTKLVAHETISRQLAQKRHFVPIQFDDITPMTIAIYCDMIMILCAYAMQYPRLCRKTSTMSMLLSAMENNTTTTTTGSANAKHEEDMKFVYANYFICYEENGIKYLAHMILDYSLQVYGNGDTGSSVMHCRHKTFTSNADMTNAAAEVQYNGDTNDRRIEEFDICCDHCVDEFNIGKDCSPTFRSGVVYYLVYDSPQKHMFRLLQCIECIHPDVVLREIVSTPIPDTFDLTCVSQPIVPQSSEPIDGMLTTMINGGTDTTFKYLEPIQIACIYTDPDEYHETRYVATIQGPFHDPLEGIVHEILQKQAPQMKSHVRQQNQETKKIAFVIFLLGPLLPFSSNMKNDKKTPGSSSTSTTNAFVLEKMVFLGKTYARYDDFYFTHACGGRLHWVDDLVQNMEYCVTIADQRYGVQLRFALVPHESELIFPSEEMFYGKRPRVQRSIHDPYRKISKVDYVFERIPYNPSEFHGQCSRQGPSFSPHKRNKKDNNNAKYMHEATRDTVISLIHFDTKGKRQVCFLVSNPCLLYLCNGDKSAMTELANVILSPKYAQNSLTHGPMVTITMFAYENDIADLQTTLDHMNSIRCIYPTRLASNGSKYQLKNEHLLERIKENVTLEDQYLLEIPSRVRPDLFMMFSHDPDARFHTRHDENCYAFKSEEARSRQDIDTIYFRPLKLRHDCRCPYFWNCPFKSTMSPLRYRYPYFMKPSIYVLSEPMRSISSVVSYETKLLALESEFQGKGYEISSYASALLLVSSSNVKQVQTERIQLSVRQKISSFPTVVHQSSKTVVRDDQKHAGMPNHHEMSSVTLSSKSVYVQKTKRVHNDNNVFDQTNIGATATTTMSSTSLDLLFSTSTLSRHSQSKKDDNDTISHDLTAKSSSSPSSLLSQSNIIESMMSVAQIPRLSKSSSSNSVNNVQSNPSGVSSSFDISNMFDQQEKVKRLRNQKHS